MSFHCVHTDQYDAVTGWDAESDHYFLFIIDRSKNQQVFSSLSFAEQLTLDEVLFTFHTYNIPIPRDFRTQLFTDKTIRDEVTRAHYYFDGRGVETHRKMQEKSG